jgi:hypothetical protein
LPKDLNDGSEDSYATVTALTHPSRKDTEMNTSLTTRLIASIVAVGMTALLFSAVISPAMQQQADGSLRLAHSAVATPTIVPQMPVAEIAVAVAANANPGH